MVKIKFLRKMLSGQAQVQGNLMPSSSSHIFLPLLLPGDFPGNFPTLPLTHHHVSESVLGCGGESGVHKGHHWVKGESGMKGPIAINLGCAFSIAFLLGNLAAIKKGIEKNKRAPGHPSYKLKDAHLGPCLLQMF